MKYLIKKYETTIAVVFDKQSAIKLVTELRETSQSQIYYYKETKL